jgi:hypothetical protein
MYSSWCTDLTPTIKPLHREDDVEGSLQLVLDALKERIEKQDGMYSLGASQYITNSAGVKQCDPPSSMLLQ